VSAGVLRKATLAGFVLVGIALSAPAVPEGAAASAPATVSFRAAWKVGDSAVFRVRQEKAQSRGDSTDRIDTAAYEAVMKIASQDRKDSSFLVSWTYANDLGNNYRLSGARARRLAKYDRIKLEYRAGVDGEFLGIVGWTRQASLMARMLEDLVQAIAEDEKTDPAEVRARMKPLVDAFTSKEGLESIVFKDVRQVHFALGAQFRTDSVLDYEDVFPNVFGGDPIPTKGTLRATVDSPGVATLVSTSDADPGRTRALILGLMKKMMPEDSVMKAMSMARMELQDRNRYDIEIATGFPLRIETSRRVQFVAPGERAESRERMRIVRVR